MTGRGDAVRCNRCGTLVVFALETGPKYGTRTRAFDDDPHPDGTHRVHGTMFARVATWLHPKERETCGEALHRPHSTTCTNPPERNTP